MCYPAVKKASYIYSTKFNIFPIFIWCWKIGLKMTTTEKTYTEKQTAFLEALLGEARGDIRTAMTIAGYAKTTKTAEVVSSLWNAPIRWSMINVNA